MVYSKETRGVRCTGAEEDRKEGGDVGDKHPVTREGHGGVRTKRRIPPMDVPADLHESMSKKHKPDKTELFKKYDWSGERISIGKIREEIILDFFQSTYSTVLQKNCYRM